MWIIPKTLSAFVQDTEGLNLDLDERAWMLEQSAMWRSKPSSKQTWLRRLKKDAWMTHLSTRILKPSLHESFEEKYTASLEDIPVSPSVAQESEKERKTQDTCGPTSESMSGQLDLFGAFSRMSEVTPRWGYGESCPIWKKMVTERSGDCSRRRKQARLTNASDASSWPTATSRDWKDSVGNVPPSRQKECKQTLGQRGAHWATPMAGTKDHMSSSVEYYQRRQRIGKQLDLNGQVILSNWATPVAMNDGIYVDNSPNKDKRHSQGLATQASQNWATPNTMDYMETRSAEGVEKIASGARKGRKRPSNLREQVDKKTCDIYKQHAGPPAPEKSSTSGKNHGSPKLNPNWVEQLMGLPIGWTDLGSWATESSPKPQK